MITNYYMCTKDHSNNIISEEFGTPVRNNLRNEKRKIKPKGIVIHHSDTFSPKDTLGALGSRASTNYEVDREGNVHEYLDPDKYVAIASNQANDWTIAIDVTTGCRADEPYFKEKGVWRCRHNKKPIVWPPAQVSAVIDLVNKLAQKYGFTLKLAPDGQIKKWHQWYKDGYTLFRHRNYHATACPINFPIEALVGGTVDLVQDQPEVPPTPPVPPKPDSIEKKTVPAGYRQCSNVIEKGCGGQEVKDLQDKILTFAQQHKLGNMLSPYGADGRFGDDTERALKRVQKELIQMGLLQPTYGNGYSSVDGQYGNLTKKALDQALSGQQGLTEIKKIFKRFL